MIIALILLKLNHKESLELKSLSIELGLCPKKILNFLNLLSSHGIITNSNNSTDLNCIKANLEFNPTEH